MKPWIPTLALYAVFVLTSCGGPQSPANVPPALTLQVGPPCHPSAPGAVHGSPTCTVALSAQVSDPDGDRVTIVWSACATGEGHGSSCLITEPGRFRAVATARDSRGGVTEREAFVEGVNQPPVVQVGRLNGPLAAGRVVTVIADQPFDPDGDEDENRLCGTRRLEVQGPCRAGIAACGGVCDCLDVDVRGLAGPGTCEVSVYVKDSWGAEGRGTSTFEILAPGVAAARPAALDTPRGCARGR